MKRVMVGGVFNILHPGHLFFFEKAKELGDELVVVIARYEHIEEHKKENTVFTAQDRAHLVQALTIVDEVVLGDIDDMIKTVEKVQPDIIALGYDQKFTALKQKLKERGLENIQIVQIQEYFDSEFHKSSNIIYRIKKGEGTGRKE